MNVEKEILDAIRKDAALEYKNENTAYISGLRCPTCDRKSVFISIEKPYRLSCSHTGSSCGYYESTRERYSFLWENLGDKHPATPEDPNATAKAYMSDRRGFPLVKIGNWFEQGTIRLPNGSAAETVRFMLWDGFWWDRLINDRDIKLNLKEGKPTKADFKANVRYKNKCWQPPGQVIEPGDRVKIVEGIFHAIAFHLAGYKVVAAFTCQNLPRDLINENLDKNVTWEIAYDAGQAGETAGLKYLKEITNLKESACILLPHSSDVDWDDLYRQGDLNDDYLNDCLWRGRMLSANNEKEKAFAKYCWKAFHHTLITYQHQTFAVSVNTADLTKALDGEKINFCDHEEVFNNFTSVDMVLDCELYSLHSEVDKFTKEIKYIFKVVNSKNRKGEILEINSAAVADKKAFSLALLSKMAWLEFLGSPGDFSWLKKGWASKNSHTVETIPFIGYDEQARCYVFPEVGYKDGKCVKVNSHGYLDFKNFGIKTTLKGVRFFHSENFDTRILHDFIKVFDLNGLAALAYWTATLFTRQIKERQQSFPFLELTGEAQAGKTTLIRFLWKLFGRDNYEGVDVLSNSASSQGRLLSQLSNLPLVMVESDREPDLNKGKGGRPSKAVDWDDYKKIYDLDGVLMTRGVKTNDNQINESIFRGALVITQNASVQSGEATMSRINHFHCTTAHKKIENRELAESFATIPVENLAGYLHIVLTKEVEWLGNYFPSFSKHQQTLTKTTGIKNQRIIKNYAQHMAAAEALTVVFPNLHKPVLDQLLKHLTERAMDRERRLKADHPLVQQFWETYHYINDQVSTLNDEKGEREIPDEKLNHSKNPKEIAVNLNEFIEHARLRGQGFFDYDDLKKVLKASTHYRFLAEKPVNSRKKSGTARCFVFLKPIFS